MNLLIHDLSPAEWDRISGDYRDWTVISDNGTIKPCIGCFSCWTSGTGECVIKDGYEHMGKLLHQADEVVYMSRYTYGGFSSFVKNVFDRSLGYVLPEFEAAYGEMHHKKRYPEDRPVTFRFRGYGLTEEDKEKARQYVAAVCRNLRGTVKDVIFDECDESSEAPECAVESKMPECSVEGKMSEGAGFDETSESGPVETSEAQSNEPADRAGILLVDCSIRGERSNTRVFLQHLLADLASMTGKGSRVWLKAAGSDLAAGPDSAAKLVSLASCADPKEIVDAAAGAETIVLGVPLYVDGIPASAMRLMDAIKERGAAHKCSLYAVVNNGLYESRQNDNLLSMIRDWCAENGVMYRGALAIGAGELVGTLMRGRERKWILWPARNAALGLRHLAGAIAAGRGIESMAAGGEGKSKIAGSTADTLYADPYLFPRWLYILIANTNWQKLKREARTRAAQIKPTVTETAWVARIKPTGNWAAQIKSVRLVQTLVAKAKSGRPVQTLGAKAKSARIRVTKIKSARAGRD